LFSWTRFQANLGSALEYASTILSTFPILLLLPFRFTKCNW
jgi:hypothetical protein